MVSVNNEPEYDYLNMVEMSLPIDSIKMCSKTRKGVLLGAVFNYIRYVFPNKI